MDVKPERDESPNPRADPLSDEFDPLVALNETDVGAVDEEGVEDEDDDDSISMSFESIDDLERHLLKVAPDIVQEVLKHEPSTSNTDTQPSSSSSAAPPRLPKGKERLRSIEALVAKRNELLRKLAVSGGGDGDGEEREKWEATAMVTRVRKEVPTVLTRLKNSAYQGPLAVLVLCVKERRRVNVYVRGRDRLRSVLQAAIVAFDKHWNLVLRDVDETYYRPKRARVFRASIDAHSDVPPCLRYVCKQKHLTANTELLVRHLNFLFLKGDNVVLVSLI
uniref:Sm domain-containing protein n=1 Tax=Plectus sambesii TaxID=2011161 RepID=A0A914VZV4_9BILA